MSDITSKAYFIVMNFAVANAMPMLVRNHRVWTLSKLFQLYTGWRTTEAESHRPNPWTLIAPTRIHRRDPISRPTWKPLAERKVSESVY